MRFWIDLYKYSNRIVCESTLFFWASIQESINHTYGHKALEYGNPFMMPSRNRSFIDQHRRKRLFKSKRNVFDWSLLLNYEDSADAFFVAHLTIKALCFIQNDYENAI